MSKVDPSALAALTQQVTGPVMARGEAGYAGEIEGFNSAIAHHPDLVVGAADGADVAAALEWAAARGMPVGVLATGHGWVRPVSAGLLITTRRLQELTVHPETGRLRVGAGVKWRAVLDATAASGWAPPCGSSSDVGAVGYTVGGGLPVLARSFGFAADRVTALEAVTVEPGPSPVRRVTATSDPDLFWALRGGGGLAVVTALEMDLPYLPTFYGGGLFFPGDATAEVLHAWAGWTRQLPEQMSSSIALLRLPPLPEVPEPLRGKLSVHVRIAWAGDPGPGRAWVDRLRAVAPVVLDTVDQHPYTALDMVHLDPADPLPYRDAGILLDRLPAEALDRLIALAGPDSDCPVAMVELRLLGGALTRDPTPGSAVGGGGRTAPFSLHTVGMLSGPDGHRVPEAITALLEGMSTWSSGHTLLNFHGRPTETSNDTDAARASDPQQLARLIAIKATVDPENTLRLGRTLPAAPLPAVSR